MKRIIIILALLFGFELYSMESQYIEPELTQEKAQTKEKSQELELSIKGAMQSPYLKDILEGREKPHARYEVSETLEIPGSPKIRNLIVKLLEGLAPKKTDREIAAIIARAKLSEQELKALESGAMLNLDIQKYINLMKELSEEEIGAAQAEPENVSLTIEGIKQSPSDYFRNYFIEENKNLNEIEEKIEEFAERDLYRELMPEKIERKDFDTVKAKVEATAKAEAKKLTKIFIQILEGLKPEKTEDQLVNIIKQANLTANEYNELYVNAKWLRLDIAKYIAAALKEASEETIMNLNFDEAAEADIKSELLLPKHVNSLASTLKFSPDGKSLLSDHFKLYKTPNLDLVFSTLPPQFQESDIAFEYFSDNFEFVLNKSLIFSTHETRGKWSIQHLYLGEIDEQTQKMKIKYSEELPDDEYLSAIAVNHVQDNIALGYSKKIVFKNIDMTPSNREELLYDYNIGKLKYSPKGNYLAVAGREDVVLSIINLNKTPLQIEQLYKAKSKLPEDRIISISFSPDESLLAALTLSGTLIIWDLTSDVPKIKEIQHGQPERYTSLEFNNNEYLLKQSFTGSIYGYNIISKEEQKIIDIAETIKKIDPNAFEKMKSRFRTKLAVSPLAFDQNSTYLSESITDNIRDPKFKKILLWKLDWYLKNLKDILLEIKKQSTT